MLFILAEMRGGGREAASVFGDWGDYFDGGGR
jgi:hypothetical protein